MKKFIPFTLCFFLLILRGLSQEYYKNVLIPGNMAPDFNLISYDGQEKTRLKTFRDKTPVVLFFGSYTSPQFLHHSEKMEKMYQKYKDIAEFRIIYIEEGRPSNSSKAVEYAIEQHITNPRNYGERCMIARMFIEERKITIPVIIDDMENRVKEAYNAWPARIFIVRRDGLVAIVSNNSSKGFEEGLIEAGKWLKEYKKSGKE